MSTEVTMDITDSNMGSRESDRLKLASRPAMRELGFSKTKVFRASSTALASRRHFLHVNAREAVGDGS
jgi:hypothetical protein